MEVLIWLQVESYHIVVAPLPRAAPGHLNHLMWKKCIQATTRELLSQSQEHAREEHERTSKTVI